MLAQDLKRQHLHKGADVSHLSRSTVSAIVAEAAGLRTLPAFRALTMDDLDPTTATGTGAGGYPEEVYDRRGDLYTPAAAVDADYHHHVDEQPHYRQSNALSTLHASYPPYPHHRPVWLPGSARGGGGILSFEFDCDTHPKKPWRCHSTRLPQLKELPRLLYELLHLSPFKDLSGLYGPSSSLDHVALLCSAIT